MAAKANPLVALLELDAAEVRRMFREEVLRRDRSPPEDACARVADIICDRNRVFRLMNGPLSTLRENDPATKNFQASVESLRIAAHQLQQSYERRTAEFTEDTPETAAMNKPRPWDSRVFVELDNAISTTEAYVKSRTLPKSTLFDWSLETSILGFLFDEAMAVAEPDKAYGNASDGPRLRFIRIGLRLIAGIDMTEAAIKTRLGRIDTNRNI